MNRGKLLLVLRAIWVVGLLVALPLTAVLGGGRIAPLVEMLTLRPNSSPPELPLRATSLRAGDASLPLVLVDVEAAAGPADADLPAGGVSAISLPADIAFTQEPLEDLQRQLSSLGATRIVLQRSGTEAYQYFCCCDIPANNQGSATRRFESTDADPLASMRQVLEQVERWQAAAGSGIE